MVRFVDSIGGGLACLAAALATSRGRVATAATTALRVDRPEVLAALAEVGATPAPVEERAVPGVTDVWVGPAPQANAEHVAVHLYDGPDPTTFGPAELERLALARIARDRIERWLSRSQPR